MTTVVFTPEAFQEAFNALLTRQHNLARELEYPDLRPQERVELQQAQDKLFVPLTDMLTFAALLAAAWFSRRRPPLHKRFIVIATTTDTGAPEPAVRL